MTLRFPGSWSSPARKGPLLLILAGLLTIVATLLFLHAGGVVEGQNDEYVPPEVSLDGDYTSTEVVEGETIFVKVLLDRALDASDDKACDPDLTPVPNLTLDEQDENLCKAEDDDYDNYEPEYPDGRPICHKQPGTSDDERLCLEGGIEAHDSYNDSWAGDLADELVAYVFRDVTDTEIEGRPERILQVFTCNDGRATNDRKIRININTSFEDETHPEYPDLEPGQAYGYTIAGGSGRTLPPITVIDRATAIEDELIPADAGTGTPCHDAKAVIVDPTALDIDEGMTDTYTVELSSRPSDDVTITVTAGSDSDDVTVSNDGNTFTNEITLTLNNTSPQTVHVKADTDADTNDDRVTITHEIASDDTGYAEADVGDVRVNVTDTGISPGVTISPTSLNMPEGQSREYMVKLDAQPSGTVTVTVSGQGSALMLGGTDINSSSELTFTDMNWNQEQAVTVTAGQVNSDQNYTLTHSAAGEGYDGVSKDLPVTVTDTIPPGTAGVTVSPPSFSINTGASRSYSVSLNTQPTNAVNFTVTPPTGVTVNPTNFSLSNQGQSQNVTVTAGTSTGQLTITHAATSTDTSYNNISISSVTVTISQPPTPTPDITFSSPSLTVNEGGSSSYTVKLDTNPGDGITVRVDIAGHSGTDLSLNDASLDFTGGTSGNWNTEQTVTVTAGQDNDTNDDGETLVHTASGGNYDGVSKNLPVTIVDNYPSTSPGVTFSTMELDVTEGGSSQSYTIRLNTLPSNDVTIRATATDDVTVSKDDSAFAQTTDLTFTSENGTTPQIVYVKAGPDTDTENDDVTITHAVQTGSSSEYLSVSIGSVKVTVTEPSFVTRNLVFNPESVEVVEGDSGSYMVKLTTQPSATVVVTIEAAGDLTISRTQQDEDYTSDSISLQFTTTTGTTLQTVYVRAGQDSDCSNDSITLSHSAFGGGYVNVAGDLEVTINDNDPSSTCNERRIPITCPPTCPSTEVDLSVSPGRVKEGAGETSLTVKGTLNRDTRGSETVVTLSLTGGTASDSDFTVVTPEPPAMLQLAIPANQKSGETTISFTPVNDSDVEGDETVTVSGTAPAGLSVDPTTLIIEDVSPGVEVAPTLVRLNEGDSGDYEVVLTTEPSDDVTITITAGEGVTASPTTLTFTPGDNNWETPQEVMVTANLDRNTDNEQVAITHAVDDGSASEYLSVTIPSVTVEVTDIHDTGVIVSPTRLAVEEARTGQSDFYEVWLASSPEANVTIVITSAGEEVATTPDSLLFTPGNYATKQPVAIRAGRDDDTEDGTVLITHRSASEDANYNGLNKDSDPGIDSVEVTVYDTNRPGEVTVSREELWIEEGRAGMSDAYTVTLETRPYDDVNITITAGGEVTTIPPTLTFTPADWDDGQTSQTVLVSADHDEDTEDDMVTITHTVNTNDRNYADVEIASVAVTVIDDDAVATVAILPTSLWVEEGRSGTSDTYAVRLRTQPSASVNISITAGGDVTTSPSSLIFTPNTWDTPRTVMVSAAHDDDSDDDLVVITHSASSFNDSSYNNLVIDSVTVTVYDDDAPASVVVVPTALWIEEGRSGFLDNYTVRLATAPTANVNITVGDGGDVTASPSTLTFTPTNWGTERTVAVSAAHDADSDDDLVTLTHTASSSDGNYNALEIDSVAVTVYDDDATAGVVVSPSELWIEEGRAGFSDYYTVRLRTEPAADVVIDITAGGDVTANPSRLTFRPSTGRTEQRVLVTADHDQDTDDDQVTITHAISSADGNYNGLRVGSVAVTVYDDDTPVPTVEPRAVTVRAVRTPTRAAPTPTPTTIPTPTPTLAPTATPTPTPTPTPTAIPGVLDRGEPQVGEAEPRDRNLLEEAAAAGRDRLPLVILLAIALIVAGLVFVYLILRRR